MPVKSAPFAVPLPLLALMALLVVIVATPFPLHAQGLVELPRLEARVTDLTGTLTAEQQQSLEAKLAAFEARKGAQIALVMVPTTEPEDIAQFGIRLADANRVGREEQDDGVILIVAKEDREMRIEVGYGLEGALTDATSSRIINDTIAPLFKQGDYFGGINAGLDQIIRVVDGEPLPAPDQRWRRGHGQNLPLLLIGALFLGSVLRRAVGRAPAALLTGLGSGFVVWLITSLVSAAAVAGVVLFLFTIAGGGHWGRSFGSRGGWGGGLGGGWGGGGWGGGGGGWSGGGGGFGGGGASGRW